MARETEERRRRLEAALELAREAGRLILEHFQSADLSVEHKRDSSPVTVADRGAEQLIRERLAERFPDDGVLGEEFGETIGTSGWRWILDPVDGTKSFIHGVPLFGTLIGVECDGRMEVGVCRIPALDEMVYAAHGEGAWWDRGDGRVRPARVSAVQRLDEALVCTTTITGWDAIGRRDAFDRVCRSAGLVRGWGDCYGHLLVATGRADVMLDPELSPWDCAALIPIVQQAGGEFVDFEGVTSIDSSNGLSVNAHLKGPVLAALRGES